MSDNPYQSPSADNIAESDSDDESDTLWPRARKRRERMVSRTIWTWLSFGLTAVIFTIAVVGIRWLER